VRQKFVADFVSDLISLQISTLSRISVNSVTLVLQCSRSALKWHLGALKAASAEHRIQSAQRRMIASKVAAQRKVMMQTLSKRVKQLNFERK